MKSININIDPLGFDTLTDKVKRVKELLFELTLLLSEISDTKIDIIVKQQ